MFALHTKTDPAPEVCLMICMFWDMPLPTRIHENGLFTYMWLKFMVNVGEQNHTWILWDMLWQHSSYVWTFCL